MFGECCLATIRQTADMPSMAEQEVKGVENCRGIELLSEMGLISPELLMAQKSIPPFSFASI